MSDSLLILLPLLVASVTIVGGRAGSPTWIVLAVSAAQSFILVWYKRFPLTVLIAMIGLEMVLINRDSEILVGPLVAASGLGAWGGRRRQLIGLAIGLGILAMGLAGVGGTTRVATAVVGSAATAALFVGSWLIGRHGARRRGRIKELDAYTRQLEAERELIERHGAERERALLARELHDILNHAVTAMVLDADAARETGDTAEVREALHRVAKTGREALAELRRLLGVLRKASSGTDHDLLAVPPRLANLDDLIRAMPAGGPRVRLERHGEPRPVSASVELAAYRVVQESLTNVARHAGPVDVAVSLAYGAGGLVVCVTNAPPSPGHHGGAGAGGGMGLAGMRERVQLIGGSLRAEALSSGGFEVRAFLPVQDAS
jgi:signal transduction histidine kinase